MVKAKSLGLNLVRDYNTVKQLTATRKDLLLRRLLVRGASTHCAALKMIAQNYIVLSAKSDKLYDSNNGAFQQDGATCHTARATIDLLKDTFGDRLISRFAPVKWPPRSCDSTPLDYFLWGYVKSLVYADKPQTLDHLEDNIRRVIADIRPQTECWKKSSKIGPDWITSEPAVGPMPEIIFKM
ncbi:uncharacterized protein TNCV_596761 [Trichonephila clavipes]|nr:uncharacterized protein TNCV_596761 [Trichonephila clavipes]